MSVKHPLLDYYVLIYTDYKGEDGVSDCTSPNVAFILSGAKIIIKFEITLILCQK